MKKEKTVRTYQRRTKTGKVVTVRQHTAKYDAAEKAMEASKKKGAGDELEVRKKKLAMEQLAGKKASEELEKEMLEKEKNKSKEEKVKKEKTKKETKKVKPVGSGTNGPVRKSKKESKDTTEQPFTAAEFKEWYHGTGSAADKKVAKALRAQLGRSGYRKFEDEAIDNYSSRGHLSMFKRVSVGSDTASNKAKSTTTKRVITNKDIEHALGWDKKRSKAFDAALKKVTSSGARTTREVKEGLAKLGYDYDTGKKVKKTSEKKATEMAKKSKEGTQKEKPSKTAKNRLKQLREELTSLKQKEESRPKPPKGFKEKYLGVKEGSATFKKLKEHPDYGHGFNLLTGKYDFFYEPKSKPADTGKSIYKVAKKIEKGERRLYQDKYGVTHKEIADLASSEGYHFRLGSFYQKGYRNKKSYQYFAKKAAQQKPEEPKASSKEPIKDPFERAELIRALKSKGKGNFNRVKMSTKYKEYFAKGSWNPSKLGKQLLAEETALNKKEHKGKSTSVNTRKVSTVMPTITSGAKKKKKKNTSLSTSPKNLIENYEAWFASGGGKKDGMTEKTYLNTVKKHLREPHSWEKYLAGYKELRERYKRK